METFTVSVRLLRRRIGSQNTPAEMDSIPGQIIQSRFSTIRGMINPAEMETIPGNTIHNSNTDTCQISPGDNTTVQALAASRAYRKNTNSAMTSNICMISSIVTTTFAIRQLAEKPNVSEEKGRTRALLASFHTRRCKGHTRHRARSLDSPFLTDKAMVFNNTEKHTMEKILYNL